MSRLIDADICLNKAWQNFYKQEDEHEKNIDGYDIMRDQFYEQSGFECCQQAIVNAPTVAAIPLDKIKQAREEMEIASYSKGYDEVLEILDKLIESEG